MVVDIRVMFNLEAMLRDRGYNMEILSRILQPYRGTTQIERHSIELENFFQNIVSNYESNLEVRNFSDAYSISNPGVPFFLSHRRKFKEDHDKLNLAYSFRVVNTDNINILSVIFSGHGKMWAEFTNSIIAQNYQQTENPTRINFRYIFIHQNPMTSQAKSLLQKVVKQIIVEDPQAFQSFEIDELVTDPLDCEMAPIYIPATLDESNDFFKVNMLTRSQMPRFELTDPAIKRLGCAPGTVVKCYRTSNIPGHIVNSLPFFRIVGAR